MTFQQQLKKALCTRSGKYRRGAKTRIAELLQVSRATINNWLSGEWEPGEASKLRFSALVKQGVDLSPKKTGPK